jgi:hypothetical protein
VGNGEVASDSPSAKKLPSSVDPCPWDGDPPTEGRVWESGPDS